MFFEAGNLKVEHIDIKAKSFKVGSLKVIQISDVHIGRLRVSDKKIIKALKIEKPDCIIMTGDYIESAKQVSTFLLLLEKISEYGKVYMVFGNHELKAFNEQNFDVAYFILSIEDLGVTILENKRVTLNIDGNSVMLSGFPNFSKHNCKSVYTNDILSNDENVFRIGFSHNPEIITQQNFSQHFNLFLCGHFHGGQIWMPFGIEFYVFRSETMCRDGYRRGLYDYQNMQLYINRGIGNVLFPLRFGSRPEITVFSISP